MKGSAYTERERKILQIQRVGRELCKLQKENTLKMREGKKRKKKSGSRGSANERKKKKRKGERVNREQRFYRKKKRRYRNTETEKNYVSDRKRIH